MIRLFWIFIIDRFIILIAFFFFLSIEHKGSIFGIINQTEFQTDVVTL